MSITEIPLSILESLKPMDLEEYLYNLKVYEKDGMAHTNEERGIKRKLSSLRSFYKYLYKNEFIQSNPASKVSTPKIHDKNIIRLDADEVANSCRKRSFLCSYDFCDCKYDYCKYI